MTFKEMNTRYGTINELINKQFKNQNPIHNEIKYGIVHGYVRNTNEIRDAIHTQVWGRIYCQNLLCIIYKNTGLEL